MSVTRRAVRCTQCLALTVALLAALFTGTAMAGSGPAGDIGADVWLGLFCTVLFSLLAGFARGQERRISGLEHESKQQQSQINLLSERVLRDHPSRAEISRDREEMQAWMRRLDDRLLELLRRSGHQESTG